MIDTIGKLINVHPYLLVAASAIGTWLFNNIITVMITSLPAPTKNSSAKYAYWFRVLNTIIGNLSRAKSTSIEASPNWADAIEKVNGLAKIPPQV